MSKLRESIRAAHRGQAGLTLVELVVTVAVGGLVVAGLNQLMTGALESRAAHQARAERLEELSFALDRIVRTVGRSTRLVLPEADKPATDWPENIREQTVPASPPVGSSLLATAVLSVLEPLDIDLDFDGFPDADNDRDGRIDEDPGADMNYDFAAGVFGIDDDGDGFADNSVPGDDDERLLTADEDPIDGIDNDDDGSIDEDGGADINGDGASGIAGVDDDADGLIDEGGASDDDEDGQSDEDWYDTVTFFLTGTTLIERMPVPWDETNNGMVTGRDFVESTIAEGVTRLRFERVEQAGAVLADITIEVTDGAGNETTLNRRVRVGGAL